MRVHTGDRVLGSGRASDRERVPGRLYQGVGLNVRRMPHYHHQKQVCKPLHIMLLPDEQDNCSFKLNE